MIISKEFLSCNKGYGDFQEEWTHTGLKVTLFPARNYISIKCHQTFTRVCSCNILNRRASEAVGESHLYFDLLG